MQFQHRQHQLCTKSKNPPSQILQQQCVVNDPKFVLHLKHPKLLRLSSPLPLPAIPSHPSESFKDRQQPSRNRIFGTHTPKPRPHLLLWPCIQPKTPLRLTPPRQKLLARPANLACLCIVRKVRANGIVACESGQLGGEVADRGADGRGGTAVELGVGGVAEGCRGGGGCYATGAGEVPGEEGGGCG